MTNGCWIEENRHSMLQPIIQRKGEGGTKTEKSREFDMLKEGLLA